MHVVTQTASQFEGLEFARPSALLRKSLLERGLHNFAVTTENCQNEQNVQKKIKKVLTFEASFAIVPLHTAT